MSQYTDFLGNPIKDGDMIVYARARGSAAVLAVARVERIIPLVPHPRDGGFASTTYLARQDHARTKHPREVAKYRNTQQDNSKKYVALVRVKRRDGDYGRLTQITDINKIVVVNRLGV